MSLFNFYFINFPHTQIKNGIGLGYPKVKLPKTDILILND